MCAFVDLWLQLRWKETVMLLQENAISPLLISV